MSDSKKSVVAPVPTPAPVEPEVKLNVTSAPEPDPETPNEAEPAPVQPPPTDVELGLQDQASFLESCVKIERQLPGSKFAVRGVCTKCGWQSYQRVENDARLMIIDHALRHWNEVAIV